VAVVILHNMVKDNCNYWI